MGNMYPINKCPYCGCDEFLVKQTARGTVNYRYRFDGEEAENSNMYDLLSFRNKSKFTYCVRCGKKLFKITDDMNL